VRIKERGLQGEKRRAIGHEAALKGVQGACLRDGHHDGKLKGYKALRKKEGKRIFQERGRPALMGKKQGKARDVKITSQWSNKDKVNSPEERCFISG